MGWNWTPRVGEVVAIPGWSMHGRVVRVVRVAGRRYFDLRVEGRGRPDVNDGLCRVDRASLRRAGEA